MAAPQQRALSQRTKKERRDGDNRLESFASYDTLGPMKRSHFLSLSVLASLGSTLSLSAATSATPQALRDWVRVYRATVQESGAGVLLRAKVPHPQLAESLASLADLCDGAMYSEGNQLRGTCDGQAFELSLS